MNTVLTVDEALQYTCALCREQADRGHITLSERDLLIDGAILLAMRVDELAQKGSAVTGSGGHGKGPAGRHQRHVTVAAA